MEGLRVTGGGGAYAVHWSNQFASTQCDRGVLAVPPKHLLVGVLGHDQAQGSATGLKDFPVSSALVTPLGDSID